MKTVIQTLLAAINLYSEYFLGLVVSIIIARSLAPEDYGLYASVIWAAGMLLMAMNAGLTITVTKFIAEFKQSQNKALAAIHYYLNRLKRRRQLIVLLLALLALLLFSAQVKITWWLVALIILCTTLKADYYVTVSIFKGLQRFDVLAKTGVIINPFNLAGVALVYFIAPSIEHYLLAFCVTSAMYYLLLLRFKKVLPEKLEVAEHIAQHQKRINHQVYSATVLVFLGALIFRQTQVFILEQQHLLAEAGFFNIAFILATAAITLVPGVYQEVLLPKITQAINTSNAQQQVDQASRYLIILAMLVAAPVILYADVIIGVLYGQNYQAAVLPLQCMVVFKTAMIFAQGTHLTLVSKDRQKSIAQMHIGLAILMIALSFWLVPVYGLNGALAVYGIVVSAYLLGYWWLGRQINHQFLVASTLFKVLCAVVIAIMPSWWLKAYLSGFVGAALESLLFVVIYAQLLFLLGVFGQEMVNLLEKIKTKLPDSLHPILQFYIARCH